MKKSFCAALMLFVSGTTLVTFTSCESEDYFETIDMVEEEYSYLSLSDEEFEEATFFCNSTFNQARVRFNKTKKIKNGKIVQALDPERLMMSANLIEYFYQELEQTNKDIKEGKLLLYSNPIDPFDFCCYDASFKMRGLSMSLTRSEYNSGGGSGGWINNNDDEEDDDEYEEEYTPLDLNEATSDEIMGMIDQMQSDRSGDGYNYFNEYVDMNSYKEWNMGDSEFSKNYKTEIEGKEHSYTVYIYNIKFANGGHEFSGMYSIAQKKETYINGVYRITYENGRGDCLMSIHTTSYEVYQKML